MAWPLDSEEPCLYDLHSFVATEAVKHVRGFQTKALLIFGVSWILVFQQRALADEGQKGYGPHTHTLVISNGERHLKATLHQHCCVSSSCCPN